MVRCWPGCCARAIRAAAIEQVLAALLRLLALVALLAAGAAAAGGAPAPRFDRGLLWRVDAPNARPNYLFGTLHLDDDRVTTLAPQVRRALARSRLLMIEMVDDEDSAGRFRSAMLTREPQLAAQLGEDTYRGIEPLLAEHGVAKSLRPRLKPWAALLTLSQPAEFQGIILDQVLAMEARRQNKPILGLESAEEQIAAFDAMPLATQLALLRHAQAHYAQIQDTVGPLRDAYLARDLDAIWRLNLEAMAGDASVEADNEVFLERVLYARSRRFAERLAPQLRRGGVFAAMGALHLYGRKGVLSLLAERGLKLRRIY
jgi:uncharacterized protein